MRVILYICGAITACVVLFFVTRTHQNTSFSDRGASDDLRHFFNESFDTPNDHSHQRKIDDWFASVEAGEWSPFSDASTDVVRSAMACLAEQRVIAFISSFTNETPGTYSESDVKVGYLSNGDTIAVVQSDRPSREGASRHKVVLVIQDCRPIGFAMPFIPLWVHFTLEGADVRSNDSAVFRVLAANKDPIWPPMYFNADANKLAVLKIYSSGYYEGVVEPTNKEDAECKEILKGLGSADRIRNDENIMVATLSQLPPRKCFITKRPFAPKSLRLGMTLIEPIHGSGSDTRKILDTLTINGHTKIIREFAVEEALFGDPPEDFLDRYTFSFDQFRSAPRSD